MCTGSLRWHVSVGRGISKIVVPYVRIGSWTKPIYHCTGSVGANLRTICAISRASGMRTCFSLREAEPPHPSSPSRYRTSREEKIRDVYTRSHGSFRSRAGARYRNGGDGGGGGTVEDESEPFGALAFRPILLHGGKSSSRKAAHVRPGIDARPSP